MNRFLPRPPLRPDVTRLEGAVAGRRLLVTGAAGSLGREVVDRALEAGVAEVLLLDHAETELADLEDGLRTRGAPVTACLGDVADAPWVDATLARTRPELVVHAAAVKHVGFLERHPLTAARINALGTWNVLDAARRAGARRFVLVSTDKAAAPVSVLGATKAVAERAVAAAGPDGPVAAAVRLGNVLGSRGSVLVRFAAALDAGAPLRLTHPEARRFVMTGREAAEMVLLALDSPGRGALLAPDLGPPVRIADLARRLLEEVGRDPEDGLRIVGLSPGERLEERLVGPGEALRPCGLHPLREVVREPDGALAGDALRDALADAVGRQDPAAVLATLVAALPGFEPGPVFAGVAAVPAEELRP